jgi:hypothetical protein
VGAATPGTARDPACRPTGTTDGVGRDHLFFREKHIEIRPHRRTLTIAPGVGPVKRHLAGRSAREPAFDRIAAPRAAQ